MTICTLKRAYRVEVSSIPSNADLTTTKDSAIDRKSLKVMFDIVINTEGNLETPLQLKDPKTKSPDPNVSVLRRP